MDLIYICRCFGGQAKEPASLPAEGEKKLVRAMARKMDDMKEILQKRSKVHKYSP